MVSKKQPILSPKSSDMLYPILWLLRLSRVLDKLSKVFTVVGSFKLSNLEREFMFYS